MSEGKHTPGDWCGTGNGFVRVVGSEKPVASTYGDRDDCEIDDMMLANERLIAAAPDMLEALYQCLGSLKALGAEDGYASEAARAAISKASQ